jgi:hypothetical protein
MVCTRCRVDVDMARGFTSGKGRPALRGDYFQFGLIFIKKIIKLNLKKTETASSR